MKSEEFNMPMMAKASTWILLTGLLLAICFATQYGLPLQSPALICLSVSGLLAVWISRSPAGNSPSWVTLLVVLSAGYFFIRAVLSPVVDLAREDIFLMLTAVLMYVCMVDVLGSRQTRMQLAYVVLIGLCLHMGSAVSQFSGGDGYWPVAFFSNAERANPDGITGMYGYRGSFANYAAIAGVLALSLGIWGRFGKWFRCVLCLLAVVSMIAVFISHSRSAALSVVVGMVVMLCLLWISLESQSSKIRSRVRGGIVILGGVGVLVAMVGGYYVFSLRGGGNGVDVFFSDGARSGYWPMALEQFYDHPIWGAGSRSFSYEVHRYWHHNLWLGAPNPEFVHNEYLQLAVDYGVVGLILVVSIVGVHVVRGFVSVVRWSHDERIVISQGSNMVALGISGVVGIVVMAVHVCFDFRTHLVANLLLLVCCLVWAMPLHKKSSPSWRWVKSRMVGFSIKGTLLLCSFLGLYMGMVELCGGLPLMKIKEVTETGVWDPTRINRKKMIPSLEESVAIAPSYRRHLKLGTLYRLEAEILGRDTEQSQPLLRKALNSYLKAEQRHPYDPVIQVNLGSTYCELSEYERADKHFVESLRLSGVRGDRWFGIYWKWAELKHRRALEEWKKGESENAIKYFSKCMELLYHSGNRSKDWMDTHHHVLANYLNFLGGSKAYTTGDVLIENTQKKVSPRILRRSYATLARYYLRKGKYLWYQRKTSEAYEVLHLSQRYYLRHKKVKKGQVDDVWKREYKEVREILRFFKRANIQGVQQKKHHEQ